MKICIINDRFTLTGGGGGQYRVLGIGRELQRLGYDVTLCCPQWTSRTLYDFPDSSEMGNWFVNQYANSLKLVTRLREVSDCEAVYVQLPVPVTKAIAAYYAKMMHARVFLDFGDIWYSDETGSVHRAMSTVVVKRACQVGDRVSAATAKLKEELERLNPRIEVLYAPCGVDLSLFDAKKVVPTDMRLRSSRPVILYQGTVSRFTGCDYLVEIARKVVQIAGRDVLFAIVGDGPYLDEMRGEVASHGLSNWFVFTGRVPHERIPSFVAAADICLAPFPSRNDIRIGVFPIKVIEYMALGKAVVASCIPSVQEIVDGGAGISARVPDFPEIILDLVDNPDRMRAIGNKARAKVEQVYDWRVIVGSLLRFWS